MNHSPNDRRSRVARSLGKPIQTLIDRAAEVRLPLPRRSLVVRHEGVQVVLKWTQATLQLVLTTPSGSLYKIGKPKAKPEPSDERMLPARGVGNSGGG
jgi:hypothetical protein